MHSIENQQRLSSGSSPRQTAAQRISPSSTRRTTQNRMNSSPTFQFHSPKTRQVANTSNGVRHPQTPQTPSHANLNAAHNADGSLSVIRNDDDANNSGLLDLSPAVKTFAGARLGGFNGTPSRVRPRSSLSRSSKLPSRGYSTAFADLEEDEEPRRSTSVDPVPTLLRAPANTDDDQVMSSQPAEDYGHRRSAELPQDMIAIPDEADIESQPAHLGQLEDQEDQSLLALSSPLLTKLRRWRQDAMQQHLYETAIFWGSKLLSLEASSAAYNDAYHLAQCYFSTHQYARAEHLLTTPLRMGADHSQHSVLSSAHRSADAAQHGNAKQGGVEAFLSSDNAQTDDDALLDILSQTRANSILPPSIMARSATKDSLLSGASSTIGKRKTRDFKVTENGVGSSDSEGEHDDVSTDRRSLMIDDNRAFIVRQDALPRKERSPIQAAQIKESDKHKATEVHASPDIDLQTDLKDIKESHSPAPGGPILVNHSLACRYLAAQCQVRLGKYHDALELLGDTEHWATSAANKKPAIDGGLKLGSSVAYLRGQIHLRLEDLARSRDSFMAALALDVKNYEAFSALVDGDMLGIEEEWSFVQGLEYVAQAGDEEGGVQDYELIRLIYTTRLSKQSKAFAIDTISARRRLASEYGLGNDPDILLGLAEELFARLRFADAFVITSRILELSADHTATLPIHIACIYHLKNLRPSLFMLAHRLTELQPESPVSWYAVGVWYAMTKRWAEARRYFSKASLLDPRFAPSWIAFGHTFAMEGESDQAIIAYSTAARLFPQSHLPKLFVGVEHLHQDNLSLARLSLEGSAAIWPHDPLTANERGLVAFHVGDLEGASALFRSSIELAADTQHPAASWKACYLNLGLSYLRLGRDADARKAFETVIELDPHNHQAYLCLGMLAHKDDGLDDAIHYYHQALAISPRDAFATDLLDCALEEKVQYGIAKFVKHDPEARFSQKSTSHVRASATLDKKGKAKEGVSSTYNLAHQSPSHPSLQTPTRGQDTSHLSPLTGAQMAYTSAHLMSSPSRIQEFSATEMSMDNSSHARSVTMDESRS